MLLVLTTMLLILALAGLVGAYMVFPRRGLDVPRAPWAGSLLSRLVGALPTLDNISQDTLGRGRRSLSPPPVGAGDVWLDGRRG